MVMFHSVHLQWKEVAVEPTGWMFLSITSYQIWRISPGVQDVSPRDNGIKKWAVLMINSDSFAPKQGSSLVSFPSDLCGIVPWLKRGTKQKYDTIAHSFILRRAIGTRISTTSQLCFNMKLTQKTCFYVTWAPLHWICYLITLVWTNAINFNCRCQYWLAKWVKREHLQVNAAKISDHCFNFDRQMLCLWSEVCRLTDVGITIICRCMFFLYHHSSPQKRRYRTVIENLEQAIFNHYE